MSGQINIITTAYIPKARITKLIFTPRGEKWWIKSNDATETILLLTKVVTRIQNSAKSMMKKLTMKQLMVASSVAFTLEQIYNPDKSNISLVLTGHHSLLEYIDRYINRYLIYNREKNYRTVGISVGYAWDSEQHMQEETKDLDPEVAKVIIVEDNEHIGMDPTTHQLYVKEELNKEDSKDE